MTLGGVACDEPRQTAVGARRPSATCTSISATSSAASSRAVKHIERMIMRRLSVGRSGSPGVPRVGTWGDRRHRWGSPTVRKRDRGTGRFVLGGGSSARHGRSTVRGRTPVQEAHLPDQDPHEKGSENDAEVSSGGRMALSRARTPRHPGHRPDRRGHRRRTRISPGSPSASPHHTCARSVRRRERCGGTAVAG